MEGGIGGVVRRDICQNIGSQPPYLAYHRVSMVYKKKDFRGAVEEE